MSSSYSGVDIILSGSYWKMWIGDFSKEEVSIAINQTYLVSFNISMGIYYS